MSLSINIPPLTQANALAVLSLENAKFQIKVDHNYDDALIQSYITSALTAAESYTGRTLFQRNVDIVQNTMFSTYQLPLPGVSVITEISYYDVGATTVTVLDAAKYTVVINQGIATLQYIGDETIELDDRLDALTIKVTTGFQDVPADVLIAIKLMLSDMYEYRSNSIRNFADTSAAGFLRPYKQFA